LIVHRAAWVLPIASPPIRDGWVAVERGRVVAVGGPDELVRALKTPTEPAVILPGLVNAHIHLELAWLRGAVPPASSMPEWATRLIGLRRGKVSDPVEPIVDAVREARTFGTSLVGDVTNTLASYEPLAASRLCAAVFFEQLGFKTGEARLRVAAAQARIDGLRPNSRLRPFVVPHAPYSVSPALLRAIGALESGRVLSIHLAESADEVQFLKDGTGRWRTLLEELGAWDDGWTPAGCGPVEYLERLGLLDARLLAVHGVHLTDAELGRLAAVNATLVSCPRSNIWTGAGPAPVARFFDSGVRVAIGTDSLASAGDLSIFSELAAMRAAAPRVSASRLLESATRTGAEALGFGSELGTIEPGKRADLVAVRLPADCEDVEEYLVGGVQPTDIRWLDGD
jgi:aminodeoxyfutalosine deaminase